MKRLDINDPEVWNKWRELYDDLTDEEHAQFLNDSEAKYPSQKSFTVSNYDYLFEKIAKPGCSVFEIGGWKGELAHYCLSKYAIKSWHNIDLCRSALEKTIPELKNDDRYSTHAPEWFNWFAYGPGGLLEPYDVCLSAHTIEHLSDHHLTQLIYYLTRRIGVKTIVFEAPISNGTNSWNDYVGSHKLTMGWDIINCLFEIQGYSIERVNESCFLYQLGLTDQK